MPAQTPILLLPSPQRSQNPLSRKSVHYNGKKLYPLCYYCYYYYNYYNSALILLLVVLGDTSSCTTQIQNKIHVQLTRRSRRRSSERERERERERENKEQNEPEEECVCSGCDIASRLEGKLLLPQCNQTHTRQSQTYHHNTHAHCQSLR